MIGDPNNYYSINSHILHEWTDISEMIYNRHEGLMISTGSSLPENEKTFPYLCVVLDGDYDEPQTTMCRVSMLEPKYLGVEYETPMTKRNKERFIKAISGCWNKAIRLTNMVYEDELYDEFHVIREFLPEDFPMPDYSKLPTID